MGLNDPTVNTFLEVRHHVQTHATVTRFVQSNSDATDMILWGIWANVDEIKSLVGTVRLHRINEITQCCDIGICLFQKRIWGKGIGTAAIRATTNWALEELAVDAIYAGIYASNIPSQRAFAAAGYVWSHDTSSTIDRADPIIARVYVARK